MAFYDVTQIDSLEHDGTNAYHTSNFIKIDATHYIVAYAGTLDDGFIKTFSIDGSASTITELDSLEHDTDRCYHPSLVKIDTTHYMLAYGAGADLYPTLKVFTIDGGYNITQTSTLEIEATSGYFHSLIMIDNTHFVLAYRNSDNDGWIKTFVIDGGYAITELGSLEHDVADGTFNSLVKIDSTHVLLAYAGVGADGFLKTFDIDGDSYAITQLEVIEHDIGFGIHNSLVQIDATHYILAYSGVDYDGYIKTILVDGPWNISIIDTLEHDENTPITADFHNSLVKMDASTYMLAYAGADYDGYIKVFTIDGSYVITQESVLEHDAVNGMWNGLVAINSEYVILAYSGTDGDGYIKTFSMEPYSSSSSSSFSSFSSSFSSSSSSSSSSSLSSSSSSSSFSSSSSSSSFSSSSSSSSLSSSSSSSISSSSSSSSFSSSSFSSSSVSSSSSSLLSFSSSSSSVMWIDQTKNTTTFTGLTKHTTTFTNQNKSTAPTWIGGSKNTTVWTKQSKSTAPTWDKQPKS